MSDATDVLPVYIEFAIVILAGTLALNKFQDVFPVLSGVFSHMLMDFERSMPIVKV